MDPLLYTPDQQAVIHRPVYGRLFLQGQAGTGKTSAGAARLMQLLSEGIPAHSILVLIPQRTLASQYYDARVHPDLPPGGLVDIFTFGGLAQRMVQLFWPMIAAQAGFRRLDLPPTFLNIETAQYYMARVVYPLIEQKRYFETIAIEPNRIYSQILSNLNSAAGCGFPYEEIGDRLKAAWEGEPAQLHAYEEAQECAQLFRACCYENNLLDFSLSLELFCQRIWPSLLGRQILFGRYHHLIYDNAEEDFPAAHDIIASWLPNFDSALIISDSGGGYRSFLGADPEHARGLADCCDEVITFEDSFVTPPGLLHFDNALHAALTRGPVEVPPMAATWVKVVHRQFFPEMIEWVSREITGLVLGQRVRPGEIAVLAPYLTDSLRFSLTNRLKESGIPTRTHRPSRALRDEPAVRCMLTLARLAHQGWKKRPSPYDVRQALMMAIEQLDLIRADLLVKQIYFPHKPVGQELISYYKMQPIHQERISHQLCQRYEKLYQWILDYRAGESASLDIFFSRLFGEVLSTKGFGFHNQYDAANLAARLIEAVQEFRQATGDSQLLEKESDPGLEFVQMVEDGVIGSQFLAAWMDQPEDAVFIAPAYTFLVSNRPARFQFWLDISSQGWWQRLDQPLTHPYVLSRSWPSEAKWNTLSERQMNLTNLARLTSGLVHRCSDFLYLCSTDVSERGEEQQGQLVVAVNKILKQAPDLLEEARYD